MKILKIKIAGLKLYQDETFEYSFVATQNATDNNSSSLNNIFGRVHTQNVMSIVGINASGKSTAQRLIYSVMKAYLDGKRLENYNYCFVGDDFHIEVYLYDDEFNKIYKVVSAVEKVDKNLRFVDEVVYEKGIGGLNRKNIYDFDENAKSGPSKCTKKLTRDKVDKGLLPDDYSVFRKVLSDSNVVGRIPSGIFLSGYVGDDYFIGEERASSEILHYLDPSIEYFKVIKNKADLDESNKSQYALKFYGSEEKLINNVQELSRYLSSGTMKGISYFTTALLSLRCGNYLLVDELENHFNRAIVNTFINMFMDKQINKNNAVLIFSTHYPEILDILDRNDNVYVAKRKEKMTLDNMSNLLDRGDLKKSEVFESNYLGGTAPNYDSMMAMKNKFKDQFN